MPINNNNLEGDNTLNNITIIKQLVLSRLKAHLLFTRNFTLLQSACTFHRNTSTTYTAAIDKKVIVRVSL